MLVGPAFAVVALLLSSPVAAFPKITQTYATPAYATTVAPRAHDSMSLHAEEQPARRDAKNVPPFLRSLRTPQIGRFPHAQSIQQGPTNDKSKTSGRPMRRSQAGVPRHTQAATEPTTTSSTAMRTLSQKSTTAQMITVTPAPARPSTLKARTSKSSYGNWQSLIGGLRRRQELNRPQQDGDRPAAREWKNVAARVPRAGSRAMTKTFVWYQVAAHERGTARAIRARRLAASQFASASGVERSPASPTRVRLLRSWSRVSATSTAQ